MASTTRVSPRALAAITAGISISILTSGNSAYALNNNILNNAPMVAVQHMASQVPSQGVVLNEENFPDPKFIEYIRAYAGIPQGNVISPEQCEKLLNSMMKFVKQKLCQFRHI